MPARKPYRIGLLFTHKNGDFGAISLTERSCAAPIFYAEGHISDRCSEQQMAFRVSTKTKPDKANIALRAK